MSRCVKSGKDTVQIEKNDLSMYVMMHDLAKEIYGFTDSQKSLEKSYCVESSVNQSRDIESLKAMIREKQAELISLKRELAGLMELPKADTAEIRDNSTHQTEELRFSPILSTMGHFKNGDSASDSDQAVSEELKEDNVVPVKEVEREEENKGEKERGIVSLTIKYDGVSFGYSFSDRPHHSFDPRVSKISTILVPIVLVDTNVEPVS